jgi:hypothetical protein
MNLNNRSAYFIGGFHGRIAACEGWEDQQGNGKAIDGYLKVFGYGLRWSNKKFYF